MLEDETESDINNNNNNNATDIETVSSMPIIMHILER